MSQKRANCFRPEPGLQGPRSKTTHRNHYEIPQSTPDRPIGGGAMLPVVKNLGPRGEVPFTLEGERRL